MLLSWFCTYIELLLFDSFYCLVISRFSCFDSAMSMHVVRYSGNAKHSSIEQRRFNIIQHKLKLMLHHSEIVIWEL